MAKGVKKGRGYGLTGAEFGIVARLALLAAALGTGVLYLLVSLEPIHCAIIAFTLSLLALLSFPRVRSNDLLITVAIALTIGEFATSFGSDTIAIERWTAAVGVVAAVALMIRVQRLRAGMIVNPYVPLAMAEQRRPRRAKSAEPEITPDEVPDDLPLLPAPVQQSPTHSR